MRFPRVILSRFDPRNRPSAHVIAAANFGKAFLARLSSRERLLPLVGGELEGPAKALSLCLGAAAPLAGAGLDQFVLEFRHPAQHAQHEPAMRGGGVGPHVGEGSEPRPTVGNGFERVQKIEGGACQSV